MDERSIAAVWLYSPVQAYVSTHDNKAFTCFDVMVARGVYFLPQEHRAALCTFDWLGREDAEMDWQNASFVGQVQRRLVECAADDCAITPCLYKL